MGTAREGERMRNIFIKYFDGRMIDKEDKDTLDRLVLATCIVYSIKDDGTVHACASETAKGLKKLIPCETPSEYGTVRV